MALSDEIRKVEDTLRDMAIDRRDPHVGDRRDLPVGGRRQGDHLTAKEVLELANREEFIALDVIAKAFLISRRALLRDWESRQFPLTRLGRRILLPSAFVLRAYFSHTLTP